MLEGKTDDCVGTRGVIRMMESRGPWESVGVRGVG